MRWLRRTNRAVGAVTVGAIVSPTLMVIIAVLETSGSLDVKVKLSAPVTFMVGV